MFITMAYYQGELYEEIAGMFENAPTPKDIDASDKKKYCNMVEEKVLKIRDEALKRYEQGVKLARILHIDTNNKMQIFFSRIWEINPMSEYLFDVPTAFLPTSVSRDTNDLINRGVTDSIHDPRNDSGTKRK